MVSTGTRPAPLGGGNDQHDDDSAAPDGSGRRRRGVLALVDRVRQAHRVLWGGWVRWLQHRLCGVNRCVVLLCVTALNAVTVGLLSLAGSHRSTLLLGGAAVLVVGATALGAAVRWVADQQPASSAARYVGLAMGAALAAAGVALVVGWFGGHVTDGWGFVGVSTALLGAGHLMVELRALPCGAPWRGFAALGLSTALVVGALLTMTGGAPAGAGWVALAGVLLAPVGLGLATEDVIDRLSAPGRTLSVEAQDHWLYGSLLAVALGIAGFVVATGLPRWPAVVAGLAVCLLVGAVASRTNTDAVLVLLVVALVWTSAPRATDPDGPLLVSEGDTVLVALGDSFMSGEGAETYYAGTNTKGQNACRRAPTSYPVQVVRRDDPAIPDHVLQLACSGATANEIYRTPQFAGDPVREGPGSIGFDGFSTGGNADTDDAGGGLTQLQQLHDLRTGLDLDVDLVVVSIGGNDAGFGEVARTCVLPGDCSELRGRWFAALDAVGPEISAGYAAIRAEVGPDVPVVVIPYPVPLDEDGCGYSTFAPAEHAFLHAFTRRLNTVLRTAASDAGFHYLGDMETALEDARLRVCDDEPDDVGVNFLAAHSVQGLTTERLNPLNWFHNSLHPNATGHARMAKVLADWIDDHPDVAASPLPTPIADRADSPDGPAGGAGDDVAEVTEATGDWALDQTVGLAGRAAAPLALLIAGSWALWAHLSWRRRQARAGRPV